MQQLILATGFFLGIHLCISGTSLRDVLVRWMGEGVYRVLFSLLSLAGLFWLIVAYSQSETRLLWEPSAAVRHLAGPLVLLAFLFAIGGILSPNPASVGGEGLLQRGDAARGIVCITRHPFLWGVAIWAATHMAVNGDTAALIFFGNFLALALLGTLSIDAKRLRLHGRAWQKFMDRTSNPPLVAILAGRNHLQWHDIGWWRPAAAVVAWLAVLLAHRWLFGVSPVPAL